MRTNGQVSRNHLLIEVCQMFGEMVKNGAEAESGESLIEEIDSAQSLHDFNISIDD